MSVAADRHQRWLSGENPTKEKMENSENVSIEIPGDVRSILNTLEGAGFEAYIVGGCVRDSILGRTPSDWDITTSALPAQVKSLFPNTADNGIKHGTVMVIKHGRACEVTTYRIDGIYKDGRHPESVCFTPSLEEDLKRRDFTVNAFAYSERTGIVDLFDGLSDLKSGIVRAVGDPKKRFSEDALRMMRAVRFSAQLSFKIEKDTENAIRGFAKQLSLISRERILAEFEKTLFSDNPGYVNRFEELDLAEYIIPGHAEECFLTDSVPLYESLSGSALSSGKKELMLAAFFKELDFSLCRGVMRKMTFDNRTAETVCAILKYKDYPFNPDEISVRGALRQMGTCTLKLVLAFNEARGKDVSVVRNILEKILERGDAFCVSMLDINGTELMEAGVPEGREIGFTLEKLLDAVTADPSLNKKEKLFELIQK